MNDFHSLKISDKKVETPHSVSISFEIPESLKDLFRFIPGQYLTISHTIDGLELRRSYSLCSSSSANEWRIGVKKVEGGTFSNFANEILTVGDYLKIMKPQGHFLLAPDKTQANHYMAIAAGSGITPIMSMIKSVLDEEPSSTFALLYGNQTSEEAMFFNELEALKDKFPERLTIDYFFSRERVEGSHFGRIEKSMVNYVLKNQYPNRQFHSFYLCGPEEMISEVSATLKEKGIGEDRIHFELFSSSIEGELQEAHEGQTELTVTVDDMTETFVMDREKSVLDSVLDHDLDAPYSCQGGICSTCIARVKEGKVEMRKNQVLTDSELAEGLILTCQSHPTTAKLVIDYDDV